MSVKCIQYKSGFKYQLTRRHIEQTAILPPSKIVTDYITLGVDGTLEIERGYAWDGSSGPTIDSKSSMRGSLGHDAKYQLIRLGLLDRKWRAVADTEFHQDCLTDGMWGWRARLWYEAVDRFAAGAAMPGTDPLPECAPGGDCCS